jgi:hypothetical protein
VAASQSAAFWAANGQRGAEQRLGGVRMPLLDMDAGQGHLALGERERRPQRIP